MSSTSRLRCRFAVCALVCAALLGPVLSAPGDLDGSWEGGTEVELLPGNSFAWDALIQKDGRTVVIGESGSANRDFTLIRYLDNGTPDPSFGGDGFVTTDLGGTDASMHGALQKDGRILAAGTTGSGENDFALVRYLSNGDPDPSFGVGGVVVTDIDGTEYATGLFLAKKNRIVVAGRTGSGGSDFVVARYLSDGSPDLSFSGDGIVRIDVDSGSNDLPNGAAMDKKGSVLIGGFIPGPKNMALARVLKDGTPDPNFGQNGRLVIDLSDNEEIEDILPLANGRIMLSGVINSGQAFVMRLLNDGSADPSFGDNGFVLLDQSEGSVYAGPMEVGKKGRVLVSGSTEAKGKTVFTVWALDKSGNLDPAFGQGGIVRTPIRTFARILGTAADKNHLFAAGFSHGGADPDITLARYLLK